MTAKVWAISTNKGGCLKTSITTCLAGVISKNHKVLIVDTDNQGDCLLSFGGNPDKVKTSLYDVLVNDMSAAKTIVNVADNIDMIPANDDMCFFEIDVLSNPMKYPNPFGLLKSTLEPLKKKYDYILIDTPPNLGLTQGNVLSFVDGVIIPFQPENYSMRSLVKIVAAIEDFKKQHNPKLSILGIVPTLVDIRTTLHTELLQECRKYCVVHKLPLLETIIPRSVRFASSVAYNRLPITLAEPKTVLSQHYQTIFQEVIEHAKA